MKSIQSSQSTPISINKMIYQIWFLQTACEPLLKDIPSKRQKSNATHLGIIWVKKKDFITEQEHLSKEMS